MNHLVLDDGVQTVIKDYGDALGYIGCKGFTPDDILYLADILKASGDTGAGAIGQSADVHDSSPMERLGLSKSNIIYLAQILERGTVG